jgi:hypothetical protein
MRSRTILSLVENAVRLNVDPRPRAREQFMFGCERLVDVMMWELTARNATAKLRREANHMTTLNGHASFGGQRVRIHNRRSTVTVTR